MSQKVLYLSYHKQDEKQVLQLERLLISLGLHEDEVYKGCQVYDWLTKQEDVFVIYVLSQAYMNDVACLNEMGALWIQKTQAMVILLEDVSSALRESCVSHAICVNPKKLIEMTQVKEMLTDAFGLHVMSEQTWQSKYASYQQSIQEDSYKPINKVPSKINTLSQYARVVLVYTNHSASYEVTMQESLSKTDIQTDNVIFNRDSSTREIAKWSGALMELLTKGLIRKSQRGYVLTQAGREYASLLEKKHKIDVRKVPRTYIKESIFGI